MANCKRVMHLFYLPGINPETGKRLTKICKKDVEEIKVSHKDEISGKYHTVTIADYIEIPCGSCQVCKANQAKKKAERSMLEANTWKNNEVINLTYNDENLPYNEKYDEQTDKVVKIPTLKYKDVQDFKKRLLKHWKSKYKESGIRFICAAEYGDKYKRPHYHLIMFNFEAHDKKFFGYTKKGSKEWGSEEIAKIWGKGNITIGEATPNTIMYVSNYCLKKFKGKAAKGIYRDLGVEPECVRSSNRKGLGAMYCEEHLEQYKKYGEFYVGSDKGPIRVGANQYFDKLLSDKYGDELLEKIKAKRMKLAQDRERTRAIMSGVDIETQRENDERQFLDRIKHAKQREFKEAGY